MATKRCCCQSTSCIIGSDDFNRADNTSLGSKWVEKTGDWEILSNTLFSVSEGIVLTTYRQGKPRNTTYNYTVTIDLIDNAGPWGVICKYTDLTNFDWVELTQVELEIFPTFWRRAGGADTLIMDITTHPAGVPFPVFETGSTTLQFCMSEVGWSILGPSPNSEDTWTTCNYTAPTTLPADTSVGFVGFSKGQFDNFVYEYHQLSNPPCQRCDCFCENPSDSADYKCIPETLTLTIHPTVSYLPCATMPADIVVPLRQAIPDLASPATYEATPRKLKWYSDVIDMVDWAEENIFVLECVGSGDFRLFHHRYPEGVSDPAEGGSVFEWTTGGLPTNQTGQLNDSVSCDPIVIHFQTLHVVFHFTVPGGPFDTHCIPATADDYECTVTE